eukprot:SAG31_NODE_38862_length_292_cov_2.766839_1_plen_87_part_10
MGACNPKTLVGFMKALNAYFDQLAGSYPLMRIFVTYINSDFLANNMSVAYPDAIPPPRSYRRRPGPTFSLNKQKILVWKSYSTTND